MRSIILALVLALSGCASPGPPRPINPAVTSQLVSSEPPRSMADDPSGVQTTSAEIRSEAERQKPEPAPAPRR